MNKFYNFWQKIFLCVSPATGFYKMKISNVSHIWKFVWRHLWIWTAPSISPGGARAIDFRLMTIFLLPAPDVTPIFYEVFVAITFDVFFRHNAVEVLWQKIFAFWHRYWSLRYSSNYWFIRIYWKNFSVVKRVWNSKNSKKFGLKIWKILKIFRNSLLKNFGFSVNLKKWRKKFQNLRIKKNLSRWETLTFIAYSFVFSS